MPKTLSGACETVYHKTAALILPRYECTVADIQSCVEHLFCKELNNGEFAAFGCFSAFFLFTYEDFSGKTICFSRMVRQPFSILFAGGPAKADTFEVQFTPQVTVVPSGARTSEWRADFSAHAKILFYQVTAPQPEPLPEPEPPQPPQPPAETEKVAPLPPPKQDPTPDADPPLPDVKYWRIRPDITVSAEKLLEMEENNRRTFMEDPD